MRFKSAAQRQLHRLPRDVQDRIAPVIDALADEPRRPGVTKLAGADDLYRVRVGDYRIIYSVQDDVLLVIVVKVGHRREVYR